MAKDPSELVERHIAEDEFGVETGEVGKEGWGGLERVLVSIEEGVPLALVGLSVLGLTLRRWTREGRSSECTFLREIE